MTISLVFQAETSCYLDLMSYSSKNSCYLTYISVLTSYTTLPQSSNVWEFRPHSPLIIVGSIRANTTAQDRCSCCVLCCCRKTFGKISCEISPSSHTCSRWHLFSEDEEWLEYFVRCKRIYRHSPDVQQIWSKTPLGILCFGMIPIFITCEHVYLWAMHVVTKHNIWNLLRPTIFLIFSPSNRLLISFRMN